MPTIISVCDLNMQPHSMTRPLPEISDLDYELQYIDIGNVDSSGRIHNIVSYRFEDAPSRARRQVSNSRSSRQKGCF